MEITVSLIDARKAIDIFDDGRWEKYGVELVETNVYQGEREEIEEFLEVLQSQQIEITNVEEL